jgi:hypothetical protein
MQIQVVGPADMTVPAGTLHTTAISYDATYEIEGGTITVRQTSWIAPGVRYVKQDTETRLFSILMALLALLIGGVAACDGV